MPKIKPLVTVDAYKITVVSDGTQTSAEVTVKGPFGAPMGIGTGHAFKRPGDRKNPPIGELLALKRAFEEAAKNAGRELEVLGYTEPTGRNTPQGRAHAAAHPTAADLGFSLVRRYSEGDGDDEAPGRP